MNLKKSIVGVLAFAMVANPIGYSASQSIGLLNSNDIFATGSILDVSMQPAQDSCLYGNTVAFDICFDFCENVYDGTITISYSEELTYEDFSALQGTANVTQNGDNTLTVSVSNKDGFDVGDVVELYFKAPDESEDSSDNISNGDIDIDYEYNSVYCNVDIKNVDFPDVNYVTSSSYGGITVSSSIYIEEDNGISYLIYKDHAEVCDMYLCADEDVEISATVLGVPVTTVGDYVVIPSDVKNITVSKDNEYLASKDGVVYNKDFTELLLYPLGKTDTEYSVLDSCTTIKSHAFFDEYGTVSNLEIINIPQTVTTIEDEAISISSNIVTIKGYEDSEAQRYAKSSYINFYNLDTDTLEEVSASGTCGDNLTWNLDNNGVMTISGTGDMIEFEQSKNISDTPWVDLTTYIKELVVEEGVTSLSNDAFAWCFNLSKVTLASTVSLLDYQAFYACKSLTEITLPEGLREIGEDCFSGCSLESISLPSSLIYIRNYAFSNSYFEDDDDMFGTNTFDSLYIPANVKEISSSSFGGCTNLSNITVDKNNKYFEVYKDVLYNMYDGTIVFIPQNVTVLDIPEYVYTLTYDTGYIFSSNVTTINIPSSVSEIEDGLFYFWDALTDINVSEDNMFFSSENGVLYNKDKTQIICYPTAKNECVFVLPETVKTVSYEAFNYTCKLTDIYYLGSEDDLELNDQSLNIHYNSSPTYSKGDIDGNGESSCVDLVMLKRYLLGIINLSDEQKDVADLNDDSKVNILDLMQLKRTLLNQ